MVCQTCEDLENAEALTHLYVIMKSAVMLNDSNLLEHLLSEENVMDVVSSSTTTGCSAPVALWVGGFEGTGGLRHCSN